VVVLQGAHQVLVFPDLCRHRQAEDDEGAKPAVSRGESAELREARRRIKLLEQENEVLRRAAAYLCPGQSSGKGSTRS
jgi:transposase-like protein